jgi:glycosyltransferase involved in cell wall biosynthesis
VQRRFKEEQPKTVRVLFISTMKGMGGAEIILARLLRANPDLEAAILLPKGPLQLQLQQDGHRIHVSRGLGKLYRSRNRLWPLMFILRWLLSGIEIILVCRRERPKIIQASHFAAAIYATLPARLLGIPMVWHMHDIVAPGTLGARVCRILGKHASRVIAVSHAVAEALARNGVPVSKITVVHNGIDWKGAFDPEKVIRGTLRRKYKLGSEVLLVGFLAMLVEMKGAHVFLDAIEQLRSALQRPVCFFIVGDSWSETDPYKQTLLAKAKAAQLDGLVQFTGRLSNIPEVLADLDILVHASVEPDSLPTVILEAMAMGKLIIAANCGGVSEMIQDGRTGFLYPPGNAEALARLLGHSIEGLEELATIRVEARRAIVEQFPETNQRLAFLRIYRELTDRRIVDRAASNERNSLMN